MENNRENKKEWNIGEIIFLILYFTAVFVCLKLYADKWYVKRRKRNAGIGWTRKLDFDTNSEIYLYLDAFALVNLRRVCRNWSRDSQTKLAWRLSSIDARRLHSKWKLYRSGSCSYSTYLATVVYPTIPLLHEIAFDHLNDEVIVNANLKHLQSVDLTLIGHLSSFRDKESFDKAITMIALSYRLKQVKINVNSMDTLDLHFANIETLKLTELPIMKNTTAFLLSLKQLQCIDHLKYLSCSDIYLHKVVWTFEPPVFPQLLHFECRGIEIDIEFVTTLMNAFPALELLVIHEQGMHREMHEKELRPLLAALKPNLKIRIVQ